MEVRTRFVASTVLFGLVLALGTACGGGDAQADVASLKKQVADEQQKSKALQEQLSVAQQAAQQKPAAPATGAAQPGGVTTLIGAVAAATPTPRPAPTPLPPGATPPAPRKPPASYSEAVPFTFYVETLATTSVSEFGIASTVACIPNGVFKRGQKLVWRFEIFDTSTGKRVTDQDGATVKVRLADGKELTGRFSQRGGGRVPEAPWMWATSWDVPVSYPLGALDYTITVTAKDGRTMTWTVPALASDASDSRVQIIA